MCFPENNYIAIKKNFSRLFQKRKYSFVTKGPIPLPPSAVEIKKPFSKLKS
jgi:hypothetical protein